MQKRIEQLQGTLQAEGIAAAIFRLPENVLLFSRYWSRVGFAFVFIPQKGMASLICPESELEDGKAGDLGDVRAFASGRLCDGDQYENVKAILQDLAKEHRIDAGCTIGLEQGAESVAPSLDAGEQGLPGAATVAMVSEALGAGKIVNMHPAVSQMRQIKLDEDIKSLDIVNEIGYEGIRHFKQLVEQDNMREIDIAAGVEAFVAGYACGYKGVRFARAWAQVTSGPRTGDAWYAGMVSGGRKLEKGDFVMLEMAVAADGYWCDLTETVCVGGLSGKAANIYEAVQKAQQAALSAIRDGMQASAVDAAARSYLEGLQYGEYFNHITGHGVGFAYHDGPPFLAPASPHILKAGMVHSVEPGVYIPGYGGVRIEVNALVLPGGSRVLGKNA